MSSLQEQQSAPASTSATEELSRFAHYVEFRTRSLRQAAANYLVTTPATNEQTAGDHGEDNDTEPLFVDVEGSNDGWVGLTEEAVDVPEVRSYSLSTSLHHLSCLATTLHKPHISQPHTNTAKCIKGHQPTNLPRTPTTPTRPHPTNHHRDPTRSAPSPRAHRNVPRIRPPARGRRCRLDDAHGEC